ncbi:hypothetical protein LA080_004557 [Diaporthe eres]|nr:hypothetical protein LA080_004557 [Diaporthe eres]
MHKDAVKEAKGALRAQRDWSQHISPVDGYLGGLGDPYSFIRVTVPECCPERLEIISYANEYAFLYDDEMENLDVKSLAAGTEGVLDTFGKTVLDTSTGPNVRPAKRLQAQILQEMSSLDPRRAIVTMKAWAAFVQLASQARNAPIESLAEYVTARVIDTGELQENMSPAQLNLEVEAFKRSRYKQTRHGTFFEVRNGEIAISPSVSRQFKTLRHRIAVLDPPLPKALGQFIDIVESCFEVDEWKRPSAAMMVSQMRAAHAILAVAQESRVQRGEDPGVVEIA